MGCVPTRFIAPGTSLIATVVEKESIIPIKNFSSYKELLSFTTRVIKAAFLLKKRLKGKVSDNDLQPTVIKQKAYNLLIKEMQGSHYHNEINYLKTNNGDNPPELVSKLDLFLDESGLLRSKGRMGKCLSLSYDAINPILCHKDSHLTTLIILDAHARCMHMATKTALNTLVQGVY